MTDFLFVWAPLIGAVAGLLFAIFLIFIGYRTFVRKTFLKRGGVPGRAEILKKYKVENYRRREDRHSTRATFSHYLDYTFEADGISYTSKKELVSTSIWEPAEVGNSVDIIYLPSDPDNNLLKETGTAAGITGGTIQMVIGASGTALATSWLVAGSFNAFTEDHPYTAEDHWIEDVAEVRWIGQSEDPFVRLLNPSARVVNFIVGDDDGGREYTGTLVLTLGADEMPGLKVGDFEPVLRDPDWKDRAVLRDR